MPGEKRQEVVYPGSLMTLIIVVIILSLDLLTKFIISKELILNQSVPIISNVFHLTLVHNKGAAFGLFKNQLPFLIITAIFALILIYLEFKNKTRKKTFGYKLSLALILSGTLGNLIDRLSLGYVIDFLDFRIWPVFNIADSAITVGAILLGWYICIRKSAQ